MDNEYTRQRQQLIALGLLPPRGRLGDSMLALSCLAQGQQKPMAAARAAYLDEHGAEKIKATFPRVYFLAYPGL